VEFPVTTVIVPIVIGLVVMILVILGSSLAWMRMKRSGRSSSSQTGRSSSIDEEKESKVEAVKTISNMTTTSSVDEDEHAISLQHWSSKKAVSNRYESWHIGEIDQEWVSE
jgi:biopolymer transport protein ExbB/TolQ